MRPLPTPIRPESDPGLALAVRILSHTLWVIPNLPRPGVQALHQTIRMALVAVTGLVFPEDTQTHRKSLAAEASFVGLQIMSGLLYLLLRPNLERFRMVRFLIPPSEGSILARGLAQQSRRWRGAVTSFVRRQEAALKGGSGWDPHQTVGSIYHKGSNLRQHLRSLRNGGRSEAKVRHDWTRYRT